MFFFVLFSRDENDISHEVLKQEAQGGPSEDLTTAHFPKYSLRSVASRAVLRDLGQIEGEGRPLKCFLVLLFD